jgi:hypothetical protein
VALVLIGNALLSNYNARELLQAARPASRSRDTIYAIDDLLSELTDAETGQRWLSADAKDFLSWNPIARPLRRSTPRSLR